MNAICASAKSLPAHQRGAAPGCAQATSKLFAAARQAVVVSGLPTSSAGGSRYWATVFRPSSGSINGLALLAVGAGCALDGLSAGDTAGAERSRETSATAPKRSTPAPTANATGDRAGACVGAVGSACG